MKKGQVREGIVRDVKFPNKGNVELAAFKRQGGRNGSGNVRGRNLCRRKRLQWELPQQKWLLRLSTVR